MIREIFKPSPNKYGKYFLSVEAPDDETPRKSNTKVIEVKPNNRRRLDFTDGAEEVDEEIPEEEPSEETPDNSDIDYTTGADEDFSQEPVDDTNAQVDDNNQEPSTEENPDVQNAGDTEPNVVDTANAGETEVNTDDAVDDGPDADNSEDFTSDAGEDTTDGGEALPQNTDAKKGPGLEYDSTRKYNLFENYLSLSNAIKNYISKLENNMGEDHEENQILKTATEKLREIYDLCYDYMTLKFEISTYVQSLLFFQNLVIMVQMVFDLLEKTRKNLKNSKK